MSATPEAALVDALAAVVAQAVERAQSSERLLTVREVAERWSMSETSIRGLITEGHLPHVRIGKSLRVRAAAADDYARRIERAARRTS